MQTALVVNYPALPNKLFVARRLPFENQILLFGAPGRFATTVCVRVNVRCPIPLRARFLLMVVKALA